MVSCKIKGCKNRSDNIKGIKKLHFYSFPKDKVVAEKWLAVCKKTMNLKKSARVCSDHFTASSYKPKSEHFKDSTKHRSGVRSLLPEAVPTENIIFDDTEKLKCNVQYIVKKQTQSVSNISLFAQNNNSTVLFVRNLLKIDNKPQPQIVSSTVIPSEKYVNNNTNLDVRLEKVAPAHVLDHQYAVYDTSSIKASDDNSERKKKETDLTNTNLSNQKLINQLKMQLRMKTLQQQNLQNQLKRLQNDTENKVNKRIHDILKNVFSPGQIDRLINPYKGKIKWSIEDIISAIGLQNLSLKAYNHLRENNYPLPGSSTIRKWAANLNLSEGILADVLPVMKYKAKLLSVFQKIVVLNFGKMDIMDEKCNICIVRGLFYNWMQLIYYSYNPLTINIFNDIISKLYELGYIVVAIMCDIESNRKIWTDLSIGVVNSQQCYFEHPNNTRYKIFVFPNDSYLLALTRKYYLDHGFVIKNKKISRECVEEIININKQLEGDEFHIVTDELVTQFKSNEKNAFLAKKLFSKTIAHEISCYGEEGITAYKDWKETANFFKYFGEWISLFNSNVKEDFKEGEEPYGIFLEQQNNILNRFEKIIHTMRIENNETLLPFQEQIILRCRSLNQLLIFLQEFFSIEDFPIRYIFTNRFNCLLLENVTKYLTQAKMPNKMLKAKFQARLRKCILGKFSYDDNFNQFLKLSEPCLIDFNERSDSTSTKKISTVKPKTYVSETAVKMQKFLTENQISRHKVHKNLLQLINKQT